MDLSEGQRLKVYIDSVFGNPMQLAKEVVNSENKEDYNPGYMFLNKIVNRTKLTPKDRKRLKSEFGIDASQVLSNNTITGNTYADNQSTINIGQEPETKYELLKQENKHLKEKIALLEQERNSLKSTITTLQQVIDTLTGKT